MVWTKKVCAFNPGAMIWHKALMGGNYHHQDIRALQKTRGVSPTAHLIASCPLTLKIHHILYSRASSGGEMVKRKILKRLDGQCNNNIIYAWLNLSSNGFPSELLLYLINLISEMQALCAAKGVEMIIPMSYRHKCLFNFNEEWPEIKHCQQNHSKCWGHKLSFSIHVP